jgi:NitT/TauT family transport system substrate-binding protein
LDVSIISTGGDEKSAAAVLSGQAEVGVGDPTFAAIANARGQDLRFFASLVNGVPFWGVTFRPDVVAKYKSSGLRGLRVATFPSPSTAFALQSQMFQTAGLPPAIQEGAFGALNGLLEARQADIALELEPNVSLAQARGGTVLYSMAKSSGDFAITGAVVRAAYAKSHPKELKAFCRSLDQAFAYMRTNPEQSLELLAKRFSEVPRAVIGSAMTRVPAEGVIPTSSQVKPQAWDRALQLRKSVGDLADPQAARSTLDQSICGAPAAQGN